MIFDINPLPSRIGVDSAEVLFPEFLLAFKVECIEMYCDVNARIDCKVKLTYSVRGLRVR